MAEKCVATLLSENTKIIEKILGDYASIFCLEPIRIRGFVTRSFPVVVVEDLCGGCRVCESTCFCLSFDDQKGVMALNETACKGCGTCVAMCPANALQQKNPGVDMRLHNILGIGLEESLPPPTCNYCPIRCVEPEKLEKPVNTVIRLICFGRVEPSHIIDSFNSGVDGVMVIGCFFKKPSPSLNTKTVETIIEKTKRIMHILGLDENRLLVTPKTLGEKEVVDTIKRFSEELSTMKSGRG